jgi:hypothetical protein
LPGKGWGIDREGRGDTATAMGCIEDSEPPEAAVGFEPGGEACWRDAADGLCGFVGRINHLADWPNAAATRVSYAKTGYWAMMRNLKYFLWYWRNWIEPKW